MKCDQIPEDGECGRNGVVCRCVADKEVNADDIKNTDNTNLDIKFV